MSSHDCIWGKYKNVNETGIKFIVDFCKKNKIPTLQEINELMNEKTKKEIKTSYLMFKKLYE